MIARKLDATVGATPGTSLVAVTALALALVLGAAACAGTKRSATLYRSDTQQLLATRDAQLRTCYADALATDPALAGTVTVQFLVAKKTGALTNATVDPSTAGAPAPLVSCLLTAIDGLALTPPDRNEGRATFTYEFTPTTPPA